MKPSNLKNNVIGGLERAYTDGVRKTSKKELEGIIRPNNIENSMEDQEIIDMFKELEKEGRIKLISEGEDFLEILPGIRN